MENNLLFKYNTLQPKQRYKYGWIPISLNKNAKCLPAVGDTSQHTEYVTACEPLLTYTWNHMKTCIYDFLWSGHSTVKTTLLPSKLPLVFIFKEFVNPKLACLMCLLIKEQWIAFVLHSCDGHIYCSVCHGATERSLPLEGGCPSGCSRS